MNRQRLARLILGLIAASIDAQVIPFTMQGPVAVVNVRLNGRGPFRMILDTGASACSVLPRVAELLRLKAEYRVMDITAAGDKRFVPGGKSVEVDLGTRVAGNVEFLWRESRGLADAGLEVDGVLGQSFLSRFDYLLDYKSRRLAFDSGDLQISNKTGKRLKFTRVEGLMSVAAMNPSQGAIRLILDSAASNVFLWRTGGYPVVDAAASFIAMNGRRAVSLVRMPVLVVGDQVLQQLEAVIAPTAAKDRQEDGLLPAGLFRSVYVSNSESYVRLQK